MAVSLGNSYNINSSTSADNNQKVKGSKGSLKALAVGTAASMVSAPAGQLAMKGMSLVNNKLDANQIKTINNAADTILLSTGLKNKGVKITDVKFAGLFPNKMAKAIASGKNAGYSNITNEVLINRDKLPTAVFHEMGHAFNNNSSKVWSAMQKMRMPAMAVSSLIMLFGALSKKEVAEDGKELTKGQKIKNAVRDKSGLLAFGAMLPVLLEESMASVRGCKWANKNLTADLAKKVRNTNIIGATSYIAAALGIGLAAHVAVKVKDNAQDKARAEQNAINLNNDNLETQKAQENVITD